jgi:uncharacterized membrane protein YvbJ
MAFVFFRIPKPRKFGYKPLFYNESGDRNKTDDNKMEVSADRDRLKKELHQRWSKKDAVRRKNQGWAALMITLVLIIVLIYLVFFK